MIAVKVQWNPQTDGVKTQSNHKTRLKDFEPRYLEAGLLGDGVRHWLAAFIWRPVTGELKGLSDR